VERHAGDTTGNAGAAAAVAGAGVAGAALAAATGEAATLAAAAGLAAGAPARLSVWRWAGSVVAVVPPAAADAAALTLNTGGCTTAVGALSAIGGVPSSSFFLNRPQPDASATTMQSEDLVNARRCRCRLPITRALSGDSAAKPSK